LLNPQIEWRRLQPVPPEAEAQLCQRCGKVIGRTRVCLVGTVPPKAGAPPDPEAVPLYRHEHCPPP
jgi:hypothetical protein